MKPSTNSKVYYPVISRAKGKYVWDINNNKYLDFTGSNLTVIHGYRDIIPCVTNLPGVSKTELELTKMLSKYTGTKLFRYYKNGSDAVNNAVRLARHILNDNNAEVCFLGYAGANDAYARTININGIPNQESQQIRAGGFLEVKDYKNPQIDILVFESRYVDIADKIQAKIRIKDCLKEGIKGLKNSIWSLPYSNDFVCYGKSIANGSALAVLTGRDKYMERIDEVYYSTTFGSNQDAMLEAIRTIKGFEKVKYKYLKLYEYAKQVLPQWQSLNEEQIHQFMKRGLLFNGYWQIFTIHTKKDIDRLREAIDFIL